MWAFVSLMGPDSLCDHDIKGTPVLFLFQAHVQKGMLRIHTYRLLPCFGANKHTLQLKTYPS